VANASLWGILTAAAGAFIDFFDGFGDGPALPEPSSPIRTLGKCWKQLGLNLAPISTALQDMARRVQLTRITAHQAQETANSAKARVQSITHSIEQANAEMRELMSLREA